MTTPGDTLPGRFTGGEEPHHAQNAACSHFDFSSGGSGGRLSFGVLGSIFRTGIGWGTGQARDLCRFPTRLADDNGDDQRSFAEQHEGGDVDDSGGMEDAGNHAAEPLRHAAVSGLPRLLAGRADADES